MKEPPTSYPLPILSTEASPTESMANVLGSRSFYGVGDNDGLDLSLLDDFDYLRFQLPGETKLRTSGRHHETHGKTPVPLLLTPPLLSVHEPISCTSCSSPEKYMVGFLKGYME